MNKKDLHVMYSTAFWCLFVVVLYLGIDSVSRRLLQWITRIENGLKLRPRQDKYVTDPDNESDEEGVFKVVYGRTCMASSGRSVRGHHSCLWIYEAGVILIVIRLGSNLYLKDRALNSYRAYPFLQLLGYIIMFFSIFSVTYKL